MNETDFYAVDERDFTARPRTRIGAMSLADNIQLPTLNIQYSTFNAAQPLGQSEVGDARLICVVDEHIRWLEVTVQDVLLLGIMYRLGDGFHVTRRILGWQRAFVRQFSQVPARHVLHREIMLPLVFTGLINRYDTWMAQIRSRLRLAAKAQNLLLAGELARQDELERNHAVEAPLPRLIDHAHTSARNLLQQFVVAEGSACADMLIGRVTIIGVGDCGEFGDTELSKAAQAEAARCIRGKRCVAMWATTILRHTL